MRQETNGKGSFMCKEKRGEIGERLGGNRKCDEMKGEERRYVQKKRREEREGGEGKEMYELERQVREKNRAMKRKMANTINIFCLKSKENSRQQTVNSYHTQQYNTTLIPRYVNISNQ